MTVIGEAFIAVRPDADEKQFGNDLERQVEKPVASTAKKIGLALAAGAATQFLKGAIDNARESRRLFAQTEQVIESTGQAANVTAEDITGLASSLARVSGVHDEVIQTGANMLLTFKNIKNEAGDGAQIFDRATQATLDMSVAMGTDMQQASIQVGKALNDPITGITALQRVGITFTEQQKEQIKAMQEAGDVAGAQTLILEELESQFGGQAAAQADAGAKLAVVMDDLAQVFGDALLPVIDLLAGTLGGVVSVFTSMPGPVQKVIAGLALLTGTVVAANAAIEILRLKTIAATVATQAKAAVEKAAAIATKAMAAAQWLLNAALTANPIGLVVAAIALLIAGLVLAYKKSETFREIVQAVFGFLRDFVIGALTDIREFVAATIDRVVGIFRGLARIDQMVKDLIGDIVSRFVGMGSRLYEGARDAIAGFIEGIKEKADDIIATIKEFITDRIPGFIKKAFGIESPSTLFAGYGAELMEGLAKGVDDNKRKVDQALDGVTTSARIDVNAGASGTAGAARAAATGGQPMVGTVNVYTTDARRAGTDVLRSIRDHTYLGSTLPAPRAAS